MACESLIPGGYLKLIELGLEDCVDEIGAQRLLGYTLYKDGKEAHVSFPLEKSQSHVAGRTFHNGRFVQSLRKKVASLHNVSLEQGTVTSLIEENGIVKGVQYKSESGQVLTACASLTIICDGCFSNLRRSLYSPKVDIPSYFVGFILTNCNLPIKNYGAIIVAHPSPIVFSPISSTEIRCMVNVPSEQVPSVSNGEMACYLKTQVAPKVLPELYDSFISAIEKKGNIRIAPNKIMAAAPHLTPGALLIGDALNMRHAITGGGMTVALSDVVILRDLIRPLHDLSDAFTVSKYLESFYTLRKKIFSASSNPAMENLQHTFLGYMRLGGMFSYGASAMLCGLCPRPLSLAFHFLFIAMYGVGRLLLPFPSPKRLWDGAKLLWVASSILLPYIYSEGIRQMCFVGAVHVEDPSATGDSSCDYSDGSWVYDPNAGFDRYDSSCKEIFKGWNCILNNKSNGRDIIKWRWKPRNCDLPPFDPLQFLHTYRDTNIGTSPSLCLKKWRPAGADRGFTFLHYNLTIAYHRTNLLARYGRWSANGNGGKLEALGYKEGYRVDVDVPESTWEKAPSFHDILIFNTGHWLAFFPLPLKCCRSFGANNIMWWAPSKFDPVKSPMLFFEKGLPVIPPIPPDLGLDKVLNHMLSFLVLTDHQSADMVEDLFSLKNNGTNVETRLVNQHIYNALKGSNVHILDITRMSEFRADAHPSTAGGKKHDDCMHWCLPGVTDTWNDLFVTHLNSLKI
ncbi:hypothetical protein GOBAR_AA16983 [Gossypium barbadense]|uniref:squalene monooxygenase n=1 Tax=Gossypium barbadense TaxID=3634 RepID=A0A2P5XK41_GOSBA|nr:hypothetical protein GOBAR_AA16983 [Gossypium barbadense]